MQRTGLWGHPQQVQFLAHLVGDLEDVAVGVGPVHGGDLA